MSKQSKSLRLPEDVADGIKDMADDRGTTETEVVTRFVADGLSEYGYGEFEGSTDDDWLGRMFGEAAKPLAGAGIAFLLVSTLTPMVLWYATGTLGGAILLLLGERQSEALAALLNTPDRPPWELEGESE